MTIDALIEMLQHQNWIGKYEYNSQISVTVWQLFESVTVQNHHEVNFFNQHMINSGHNCVVFQW